MPSSSDRRTVAVGPALPGWGSWDWVGTFLVEHLGRFWTAVPFEPWQVPRADAVVVIKHAPPDGWAAEVGRQAALVYCPIDHYGGADEIAADAGWLRACAKVLVHCRRLLQHLAPLANAGYVDHPLKYTTPLRSAYRPVGPLLWVGVRSNVPALAAWVNANPLPAPLDVLTNPQTPGRPPTPAELGFRPDRDVRVHEWAPARHLEFLANARAALDIKGDDFRSRHKPPAKALDFVASGVPLAMNPGTSPVEHLASLGLKVPSPQDVATWLSERYWKEVKRAGARLLRRMPPERVAGRYRKAIEEALAAKPAGPVAVGPVPTTTAGVDPRPGAVDLRTEHQAACNLAVRGEHEAAAHALARLDTDGTPPSLRALVLNDLAVLAAVRGDEAGAGEMLQAALTLDPDCGPARANLVARSGGESTPTATSIPPVARPGASLPSLPDASRPGDRRLRVAVLSFLFNWPTTGGGNVHTAELTRFLAEAGYEVRHLYAAFGPWRIGQVTEPTPYPARPVSFAESEWTAVGIVERFKAAVEAFDPDWVMLTDSWNMKPLLAGAAGGRPYILRLQALECLCPLNNVRLLPGPDGAPRQCGRHQLATPEDCGRCVRERGHTSGDLHRAERALAGVGTPAYRDALFRAFAEAAAVLAVNPLTAAMVEPHARDVRVVTAGMDPDRFPWPFPAERRAAATPGRLRVLFAGLTHEWMKGFHMLRAACERLWSRRQDFEVAVTDSQPSGLPAEAWARYIGWQSQADLPAQLAAAAVVAVPTVAQEALGRTAVEAMAAGKPVVASRLGGLPFTVADGATGLLCAPADADDLAAKLETLFDDPHLRERLGRAGRQRFEEHYAWPALVTRHYLPLLGTATGARRGGRAATASDGAPPAQ